MVRLFANIKSFLPVVPYAVLLNLNLFLHPPPIDYPQASLLGSLAQQASVAMETANPLLPSVLFLLLLLFQALLFQRLSLKFDLLSGIGYLPAFCYVLAASLFNTHIYLSPSFFAGFFMLTMLLRLFDSYNNESFVPLFDIGFYTGLASLTYLPAGLLVIFITAAMSMTRVFNWREWVICLIGLLVPYFLVFTVLLLADGVQHFFGLHFSLPANTAPQPGASNLEIAAKSIWVALVAAIAGFYMQGSFLKMTIRNRKQLALFVYLLLMCLPAFLMLKPFCLEPAGLLLAPISVFVAYIFQRKDTPLLAYAVHVFTILLILLFQYIM